MTDLRDRIKELRRVPASELRANPKNWRRHPKSQRVALQGNLDDIGYADALLARETPEGLLLIDGHLRAELTPDAIVPVLILDVDEEEADKLLMTLDPIAAMAETDRASLALLMENLEVNAAMAAMLDELVGDPPDFAYTQKIESPLYEPATITPAVGDLCDYTKARELIAAIEAADIPAEVAIFLRMAAARHIVFHFDRIADYYAAASPAVQTLIERSALVIIDSDRAIEGGFLRLHEDVLAAFREDFPDAL